MVGSGVQVAVAVADGVNVWLGVIDAVIEAVAVSVGVTVSVGNGVTVSVADGISVAVSAGR